MQHQQYAQARLSQPALLILASLTQEHYLFPGQEPGQGQALPLPYSGNYIILPDRYQGARAGASPAPRRK